MTQSRHSSTYLSQLVETLRKKLAEGTISPSEAELFLETGRAAGASPVLVTNQLFAWRELFKITNCNCDLAAASVPDHIPNFDRLVVVPSTITLSRVLELTKARADVWVHSELEDEIQAALLRNLRSNEMPYAVWVRDHLEADENLKTLSASDFEVRHIPTITLLERLLLGLLLFHQSGEHLDVIGGTLCSGSRTVSGKIPYVEWNPEDCQLAISVRPAKSPTSLVRARQVVV